MPREAARRGSRSAAGYHAGPLRAPDDARWRWLGLVLLAAAALPVAPGAEGGLYLWELVRVASHEEAIRLLAPSLLGMLLVTVSVMPSLTRLGQSLAVLAAMLLLVPLYASSSVDFTHGFRGLLDFVGRQPAAIAGGLACVAAGADLRGQTGEIHVSAQTRSAGRALLGLGSVLLLVGSLLPYRGEPELWRIVRQAWAAARLGGARLLAGQALLLVLGSLPLWIAASAALAAWRPPRPRVWLGLGARYGLSGLAIALGLRALASETTASNALIAIRTALLLAVGVSAAATAVAHVARHLLDAPLPPTPPASRLTRDVRLGELLRAYRPSAADRASRGRSVLRPVGMAPSHPWLEWLMRRRLFELASDCERPPPDPLRPDEASTRAMLAQLEARGPTDRSEEAAPRREAADAHAGRPGRAVSWLTMGRRRLTGAMAICIVAYGAWLGWLAREPRPTLDWVLSAPPEGAEALFASTLPRYVVALSRRSNAQDPSGGSSASERLADWQRALLEDSARLDATLAGRFERLSSIADRMDRTGQMWLGAVHGINQRIRELGWPFYVDGNVLQFVSRSDGTVRRLFYVTTYRVEQVRTFATEGRSYGALHVRRLDRLNIVGARLGAVRSDEPFALIMLTTIEESIRERLDALEAAGSCGFGRGRIGGGIDDPLAAIEVDSRCGQLLGALLARRGIALVKREPEAEATEAAGAADATTARAEATARAAKAARELLVALQVDATERHEIQHQADGPRIHVPSELIRLAWWADDQALERMAQELSASLAELGTEQPIGVVWTLADLTAHLLERPRASPYRYAAAVAIGRLHGQAVLDEEGRVSVSELSRFWSTLATDPGGVGSRIAPLARNAHEELFGTPIALTDRGRH